MYFSVIVFANLRSCLFLYTRWRNCDFLRTTSN